MPSTLAGPANERDVAMARQFFDGNAQGSNADLSFTIPRFLHPGEMARIEENSGGQNLNEAWVREQEYQHAATQSKAHAVWTSEFGQGLQHGPSMQHEIGTRPDCEHLSKPDFANTKIINRSSTVVLHDARSFVWQRDVDGHAWNGHEF